MTTGAISVILALHHAVKHREKSSVETLLDGLTPEQQLKLLITQDTDGNTALHYAVRWGCTETVQSLLDNLTPDQQLRLLFTQDSDGETALHYAARGKHTDIAKTLLDNLTPEQKLQLLYVKNKKGMTAFEEVAVHYKNSDTMRTLEHYQKEAQYRVNCRKFCNIYLEF